MKKIEAEDIKIGDTITILNRDPRDGRIDRSWFGDLITVVAMDLPYMIADVPLTRIKTVRVSLDTRGLTFAIPSPQYVEALTATSE